MKAIKSVLLILTVALASLAYTDLTFANNDVRKELEAVYAKIDAAIKSKDEKTLESLLAEDYEKRSGDKTIGRDEVIAQMKENFETTKQIESSKITITKVQHVEGNEIVDYTHTVKGTMTGADGKDQSFTATNKGRDWWVKDEDGSWTCVAAEKVE